MNLKRNTKKPAVNNLAADGIRLEADPTEARIVAAVVEGRSAGLSLRAIVAELAARGMQTRKGGAIQSTQVIRILRRAA